jgi:hypothetical protein
MATPRKSSDWPTPYEYDEAIMNHRITFSDPDIQGSQPLLTNPEKPSRLNGGGSPHVCVYRLSKWVVRCFAADPPKNIYPPDDIVQRYEDIVVFLEHNHNELPFLVDNKWIDRGINIRGTYFPYLKVPYIENSQTLGTFLSQHYSDQHAMGNLAKDWLRITQELEKKGVAHGDMDPSNILVCGTSPSPSLYLIDFDGAYIPAFANKRMSVADKGHENFQPAQSDIRTFGPEMDRFAALIIFLSLRALEMNPSLWTHCEASESCFLLGSYDFERLSQSKNFPLLKREHHNRQLQLCLDELQDCIENKCMPRKLNDIVNPVIYVPRPDPDLQDQQSNIPGIYEGVPLSIPLDQAIDTVQIPQPGSSWSDSFTPLPVSSSTDLPIQQKKNFKRNIIIAVLIIIILIGIVVLIVWNQYTQQQQNAPAFVMQLVISVSVTNVVDQSGEKKSQECQAEDET